MKRLLLLFALSVALLATPCASLAQTAGTGIGDRGIYQTTLSNGLQVIVVENHVAPVVHTSVWYRFGSLYETPGKTGLAHALEHMMFRGTNAISAGGLDDIVARLGAQMNGQTDYDYTNYVFDMPADRVAIALRVEADRMQHLALRPSEWAIERRAVLNELDGDESSPFFNLLSRVRTAAYPDSPSGRTPTGVRADVANATVADLRKYYDQWYAPNNAALVVAGDVNHAAVFALARHDFGSIPKRSLPIHALQHPKAATGKEVHAEFPFPFEVLDLAYAVPGDTEPGEPAISTLSTLIPNQRGPFYHALVESNVALAVDANADTQLRGGLMHVYIVLNPGHTGAEAQQIFQSTMDAMLKTGLDPELADAAKRATLAERAYDADSIGGYADLVGYTYGVVRERDRDEDRRLSSLTAADLLQAARTYLAKPNVVGHLTPNDKPAARSSQKSTAAAQDDFSGRVPNGPIVEPADIRAQLRKPTTARSKLAPVAFTLSNGLRVIVQQKTDRPTVYIGGSIASSPAFVPAGKEGLARLASSVAGFGSERYDFAQMRKAADDMAASIDLGQQFGAHGFAQDFERLLALLADGEEHPAFPDRWVELQRSQLANSISSEESISGQMVDRAYLQRLLPADDPALRYPSQTSVAAITREDLLAYTKHYWRPELTTIAVVGDVTPQRARSAVEAAFGSWRSEGPTPSVTQAPLPAAHAGHAYVATDANQVFIQLGQPAVARGDRDFDTFNVLTEILGGSGYFESRLWQRAAPKTRAGLRREQPRAKRQRPRRSRGSTQRFTAKRCGGNCDRSQSVGTAAHAARQRARTRGSQSASLFRSIAQRRVGERPARRVARHRAKSFAAELLRHAFGTICGHNAYRRAARCKGVSATRPADSDLCRSGRPLGRRRAMSDIVTINPATGQEIEQFTYMTSAQIDAHLDEARAAFANWRRTSLEERAALLVAVGSALRAGRERLAQAAVREMGKPIVQARAEIEKCAWACEYFARNATTYLADREVETTASRSVIAFRPLGVIFAIMPWNFPFWQVFRAVAPALMAGNTVVLKHADNTTRCALEIERLFEEVEAPKGLFRTLLVRHEDADALVADARIAAVTLTGSERAGIAVGSAAGTALKKCVLELGGSDAFLVLADADLESAVEYAVKSRFQNTGQNCIAAKRFIVEDPLYDRFVRRFSEAAAQQRIGDPTNEHTQIGPCARADLRDTLARQVTQSVVDGARIVAGGHAIEGAGYFFQPTVVAEVGRTAAMFREETFGPAAAVMQAEDEDHALELANDSPYGLGANIWTRSPERAQRLAALIEAGMVYINGMVASDPRLPFGGVKRSGYGRELSTFGIHEFTNVQTVWTGPERQ